MSGAHHQEGGSRVRSTADNAADKDIAVVDNDIDDEDLVFSAAAAAASLRPQTEAERSVLRRGMWSLVKEHWQLVLLLAFNLVMMDNNMVFTYFLLVQTSVNCTYHAEDGAFVQSQTVALIAVMAWRPFSGLLTDALPRHNHVLLLVSALLECGGLLAMLALVALTDGSLSPWPVLGLSIFKQCVEVQVLASTYKIFKMRLKLKCRLGTCDSQCHVISAVSIIGELTELVFNILTCVTAYLLMANGASFDVVKYVYFATTLGATLLCVSMGISISCQAASFYSSSIGAPDSTDAVVKPPMQDSKIRQQEQLETQLLSPLLNDGKVCNQAALVVGAHDRSYSTSSNRCISPARSRPTQSWICRSLKGVFGVSLAAGCILAMAVLYSAQELLYNVESLDIPGRHVSNVTPTPDNFCSGYLTNTVYQDVWENLFYFLGTIFYILVLKKIKPLPFFRCVWASALRRLSIVLF
eukprot:INCI10045.2.p1 GENE.INCI10045.2~~INCI10045.2.p1  ORF type:complete len:468 (+),score=76.86 INCI10045.2:119-1522(+)